MARRKAQNRKPRGPKLPLHQLAVRFQQNVRKEIGDDENLTLIAEGMKASTAFVSRFRSAKGANVSLSYALHLADALKIPFERLLLAPSHDGPEVVAEEPPAVLLARQVIADHERRKPLANRSGDEVDGANDNGSQGGPSTNLGD